MNLNIRRSTKKLSLVTILLGELLMAGRASSEDAKTKPLDYFRGGDVGISSSSHQDTAWMDIPEYCRNFRVEKCIVPALEMMAKDARYTFTMECSLHLMEFLEAHPERREEILRLTREGRLGWGATYNQPYESWLSGEELVRETYYGRRWIRKNLPGCDARVALSPDVPGRALQMQQILAKAGIPYLFISRYHEGLYRWLSPDGSGVLLYTPGFYTNQRDLLRGDPHEAVKALTAKLENQSSYYQKRNLPPVYCLVNTDDFERPKNFSSLIDLWNSGKAEKGLPTLEYMSLPHFFDAIAKNQSGLDTLMGERPDVWLYIQGPTHHWTSTLRREAARLLPAAETFTTATCLLKGDFQSYPAKELDAAWMDELYMDHGIGGKNGHITDQIFQRKIEQARDTGRALLDKALAAIASQVKADPVKGSPITVFNTLSWTRSDPVEVDLPESVAGPVHVVDASGNEVPSQVSTLGIVDEANVAAADMGSTAVASSTDNSNGGAAKAIDGKWTHDADRWVSGDGSGPHWLTVDFGQPRTIHRVIIRHEGSLGVFKEEALYNTAQFQVQGADSAEGPWTDLVAPVTSNTVALTSHSFAPRTVRCLRLFISKGTPEKGDHRARIFQIEAFARIPSKARKLLFTASDVPALGYRTYYLAPGAGDATRTFSATDEACENDFYRVSLAPGGIRSLRDKELDRELLNTSKFLGGEVFTMLSVAENNRNKGTDAGEFGVTPLPVMDSSFDRLASHQPQWRVLENGPVRTVYGLEYPWTDTVVRQRIALWHQVKRIDCEVDLSDFNGRLWREFRLALPVAMEKPALAYEVPMGVVEVGKDEIPTTGGFAYGHLNYTEQCRDIHMREMQNFIDASDARGGMTLSTSTSVLDWMDPTTNPASYPVLQPVLLATRRSCNPEGNWYPQAGSHNYRFSIFSHSGGWRNGRKAGIEANHPLQVVSGAKKRQQASLPESGSFFSASTDNIVISTVKKAEDDDSLVLRCYDIEGRDELVALNCFKPVKGAKLTNLIEDEGQPLSVKGNEVLVNVGHHAIETVKLRP